jgi:hypothetical protein
MRRQQTRVQYQAGIQTMKKFVALFLLLSTSACAQAQDESRAPSLGTQHQSAHSAQWFKVEPGGDTTCAQGTPYHFWTKGGTSDKLLVYFLGGGACWSSYTCSEDHPYYEDGEGPSNPPRIMGGIFDFQNPENPFLDWNVVYIPYCTGDTHWGNNVHTYPDTLLADEVKIHHKGFVNAMAAVRWAFDRFVQPSRVFLAGDSAGAYGSILFAPYLMEHYAQSQFVHLGDSGAGVGTPSFVQSIIEAWKPLENIHPMQRDAIDWATNSPETFTLTEFYKSAAKLFPQHRFVQFNTAQDKAQRFFYKSVGGQPEDWRSQMQANMSNLDQHLSNFRYYVGWGEHHVALLSEVFYRHQVNGTRLRNFVDDLANGRDVASVQCSDCASEELYDIGNPVAGGDGNQPYQDPAFRVIPQDSNQCGPASLYTVFHYLRGENVYQGTDCNQTIDLSVQLSKVTSESEFGQWVNGGSNTGTSWQQMKYALKDLRLDCSRVFAVELQAQTTERDTAAAIEERTRRLQDIHARYLTQKRPVVLHLRRKPLISGHYVVLIGYEPAQGVVYVADPTPLARI